MSATFGGQGNWGGASSMGGGGNMSQQEMRGDPGMRGLGMLGSMFNKPNRNLASGAGHMPQQQPDMTQIMKMLQQMGYTPGGQSAIGGSNTPPQPQPAPWGFPTLLEAPYTRTR